jgi:hypothetical protein
VADAVFACQDRSHHFCAERHAIRPWYALGLQSRGDRFDRHFVRDAPFEYLSDHGLFVR